ncbi:DUF615 domain-containing protein [Herbivorax sp. ANBcel31]|uniref:DUF615 domain-containing protein n=1 Tax=Herbivorax sp. ANBcel31 TaxID=3069754 RepID=UPI0027B0DC07|nr:DUF615 domain-containing protein [Herbivorax sp. ANBcel31]MDQ2085892.1 DUF615 domain-containing protein [Herbivorax sp. ANBcel31]
MAKKKKNLNKKQNDNKKKNSFLFGILAFVTALVIVIGIIAGVFYLIIKNNFNGLAEDYRNEIRRIPVLRNALPEAPEDYDPYAPENLTDRELLNAYDEFRSRNSDLISELEQAKKIIRELEDIEDKYKELEIEYEKIKNYVDSVEEKELIVDEIIASGNKEEFKEYFAVIDPENAQKIYTELMEEDIINEEALEFSRIYQDMDSSAAAEIFEELGDAKMDLVVYILKDMNNKNAALILEEMSENYAARVTEKLSKEYGIVLEY